MGWCLTLRNELSSVTHILQGKRLYEKWHLGGEKPGKGNQENCFAFWMRVSGFMVMGLVSGLSLANHIPGDTSISHPRWIPEQRTMGS